MLMNLSTEWLTLLVVAPLLVWGLWIVSEESFDELNSREIAMLRHFGNLNSSVLGNSVSLSLLNSRARRKRFLPLYFLGTLVSSIALYFVVVEQPAAITPLLVIGSVLVVAFLQVRQRQRKLEAEAASLLERELPTQIQLLTILISAGMTPARALSILAQRSDSLSSQTLGDLVTDVEGGLTIVEALDNLANRFDSLILRRFVTSLILGIERGSALGPILTSQVKDARMASKSQIMRRAGKAEIGLMIPVVFLILPISILFALWPSYQQLGTFL